MDTSVDFVFVLSVVILSIGLLLWFILVFVPQHFDDIRGPKESTEFEQDSDERPGV